jgi:hypothetical protein
MPYIVVKSDREEIDRRVLGEAVVIGRAPDCDLTIRDILLSRKHCKLAETTEGWEITDLRSKNGTSVNGEKLIGTRLLKDSDVVRLGRSKIMFYSGLADEDVADRLMAPARPVDPNDSLSGTLTGFQMLMPGETENTENFPTPNPRPKDPDAYQRAEVQDLLSAIASSSWDSIYAGARQANAGGSMADVTEEMPRKRRARPRSPIDLSLQASPAPAVEAMAVGEKEAAQAPAEVAPAEGTGLSVATTLEAAVAKEDMGLAVSAEQSVSLEGNVVPPFAEKPGETEKRFWNSRRKRWLAAALAAVACVAAVYFGLIPYIAKGPAEPPPVSAGIFDVSSSPNADLEAKPERTPIVVSIISTDDLNLPIALPTVAQLSNSQFDLGYSSDGNAIADLK